MMLVEKLSGIPDIENVTWMPMASHAELGYDSYIFQYSYVYKGVQKFGACTFPGNRSNDVDMLNQVELTIWFQDAAEQIAASVR